MCSLLIRLNAPIARRRFLIFSTLIKSANRTFGKILYLLESIASSKTPRNFSSAPVHNSGTASYGKLEQLFNLSPFRSLKNDCKLKKVITKTTSGQT